MSLTQLNAGDLHADTKVYRADEVEREVETTDYFDKASEAAADAAKNFEEQIREQLLENGEAETDLTNRVYSESYHHETHNDLHYTLAEAVKLLGDLDHYEASDSGLWEGQGAQESIKTMAAYTFGYAVHDRFKDLIEEINSAFDLDEFYIDDEDDENDGELDTAQAETAAEAVVKEQSDRFDPFIEAA